MTRRVLMLLVLAAGLLGVHGAAAADPEGQCGASAGLLQASAGCVVPGDDAVAMSQSGDGHVYTLRVKCDAFSDDIDRCKHFTRCGPETPPHVLYDLLRDGTVIGEVCLDPDQASQFGEISPGLVLREFKSLEWPSAELVIQPPGNETLVNYTTLFYTTLAKPATQTITLLGRKVVIEATPTTYVWHPDQSSETWETSDPSRPIENGDDPADMNHYVYESTGTVGPSVDVVYSGRYRVDGGSWQEIPETLTITGDPVSLSVIEAIPVLTGDY
jgi:hypothetical protein